MRIVEERPDYHVIENNCQNFVKFLLEIVCPNAPIPDTIQNVLERLQDISTSRQRLSLPGAYPPSSMECLSFVTASEMSWVTASESSWITASGDTWVTAVDCLSFRDSQFYEGSVVSNHFSFKGPKFQFDDKSDLPPLMDPRFEKLISSPSTSVRRKSQSLHEYKLVVLGGGGILPPVSVAEERCGENCINNAID